MALFTRDGAGPAVGAGLRSVFVSNNGQGPSAGQGGRNEGWVGYRRALYSILGDRREYSRLGRFLYIACLITC